MMDIAENGIIVGLVVRDSEAMLDFYENTLGMKLAASEPMDEGGTKYYLQFSGGFFKLFAPDDPPEITASVYLAETGYLIIALVVTNLEEICGVLKEKGVRFVSEVQTTDNGTQWTVIADPEGNYIELAQSG